MRWGRRRLVADVPSDITWDAETYMAVERLLFDVDYAVRRMMGWSRRPHVPSDSLQALQRAWSLGVDVAQILNEEKERLARAKIQHDMGGHDR
jgi:hypothetical protein